jgi:adenylate kinase family enzyme
MPQYLALKVCFIGYNFAGKKTQAKQMAEEFGLQTYQLSDLVDEVLAFYEQNPEPLPLEEESNQVEEAMENDPTMSEDSEDENSTFTVQSA